MRRALILVLTFLFLNANLGIVWQTASAQEDEVTADVERVFRMWQDGEDPEQVLAWIKLVIEDDRLTTEQRRDLYAIRGSCHFRLGATEDARTSFCEAWKLDRQWIPYENLHGSEEMRFIDEVKLDCAYDSPAPPEESKEPTVPLIPVEDEKKSIFKSPFLWGGIALLGATVLLVGLSGGGEEEGGNDPLPDYPPPPTASRP